MARIAGVDLPREKRVEIGLTYVYGIGHSSAVRILNEAGVSLDTRVRDLTDEEILITSDTLVLCDGRIMGKPHSREEAIDMLRHLSGKSHKVITAVTIRDIRRHETVSDTALVHFKELSDNEIEYYVDTYRPFDKAGAYGIQEWIGYIGIGKIEGSYFTIMGLPVHLVYQELNKFIG